MSEQEVPSVEYPSGFPPPVGPPVTEAEARSPRRRSVAAAIAGAAIVLGTGVGIVGVKLADRGTDVETTVRPTSVAESDGGDDVIAVPVPGERPEFPTDGELPADGGHHGPGGRGGPPTGEMGDMSAGEKGGDSSSDALPVPDGAQAG